MATYAVAEASAEDDHGRHAYPGDPYPYQSYSTYQDHQGGEAHDYETASVAATHPGLYDANQPAYHGSQATWDFSAAETSNPYAPQASYLPHHAATRSVLDKKKKPRRWGKGGYPTADCIGIAVKPPYSTNPFAAPAPYYPSPETSGGASVGLACGLIHDKTTFTATGLPAYHSQPPCYMYSLEPSDLGPEAHPTERDNPYYFSPDTGAEPDEQQEEGSPERLGEDSFSVLEELEHAGAAFVAELVAATAVGIVLGAVGVAAGASAKDKKAWDGPRRRRI